MIMYKASSVFQSGFSRCFFSRLLVVPSIGQLMNIQAFPESTGTEKVAVVGATAALTCTGDNLMLNTKNAGDQY